METIDFSAWQWSFINDTGNLIQLNDGSTILPGETKTFRGSAPDSATGAEQFLDSYNAFAAQLPPGTLKSLSEMEEALRQAHEQAPAYRDGAKTLAVDVDPPAAFDPATRDGRPERPEEPPDLIDRNVRPKNTAAELNKTVERPPTELPPQAPPPGEKEKRSADEEKRKASGADPVDLFTGEFLLEKVDFALPSVGFPFVFIRTYKSGRSFFGPFGYNWDHNYNVYLRVLNNGKIAVNTGCLQEDLYSDSGDSVLYNAPRGVFAKLERQPLGSQYEFILTSKDGTTRSFARPAGWSDPERIALVKIEDTNGNTQQLVYNGKDQLSQVVDTAGRKIDLIYSACDRLEALRPQFLQTLGKRSVEIKYLYSYDGQHLSSVVTFPTPDFPDGLMTCYEYDEQQPIGEQRSNITRVIDAKSQVIVENFYGTDTGDASFNRIVRQYFMGGEFLFKYTDIRFVPPLDEHINDASLQVELYEHARPLKLYTFNFRGNLLDERFRLCADGSFRVWAQAYRYNKNGQITEFYHANGMAEFFTYDETSPDPLARGNLLKIELKSQPNRLLTRKIRECTYEPRFQRIKTLSDEAGETTTFVYDYENDPLVRKGNLEKIVYPDAILPDGTVQTSCETVFRYDQHGQVIEQLSPEGRKTTFEYHLSGNGAGLMKKKSLHDGSTAISENFEYDALGNVSKYVDGRGGDTLFEHNLLGQVTQIQLAAVNNSRATFQFEYNEDRKVAKEYVPRGSYSDTVIHGASIIHRYDYDCASRLVKEIRNSNTSSPQVTKYSRDVHGRIKKLTNALNQETTFRYDERDLLLRETRFANDPFPLEVTYRYDRVGNLIRILLPDGNEQHFDYGENFGRLKAKTNHLGVRKEFFYGPRDEVARTLLTDRNGNVLHTAQYGYDERGRLVTHELNGLKQKLHYDKDNLLRTAFDHLGETVKYTYDNLGRVSSIADPLVTVVKPVFDANDNPGGASVEFASMRTGGTLRFQEAVGFDERNRPVSFTDSFGNIVRQVFDERDLKTEVIDSLGNRVRTYYDINGLPLRTAVVAAGAETTINRWHRDLVGRPITFEDSEGNITQYEYDSRNNLVRIIYPDGSVHEKTYDPLNYLVSEQDANGSVVRFRYNPAGQLTDLDIQPGPNVAATAGIRHSYDGFGRVSKVEKGTDVIERTYDFLNRITAEKQGASTVRRVYDDIGNTRKLVYSDGREDLFRLDPIGRVKEIVLNKKGTGNLLVNDFAEGTRICEYAYDGIFLTSKKLANGTVTNYAYDKDAKLAGYDLSDAGNALIDREQFLYDGERRKRLSVRRPVANLYKVFSYDSLSRLTDAFTNAGTLNIPANLGDQAAIDAFVRTINTSSTSKKEHYDLAANDKRISWEKDDIAFAPTYNNLLQLIRLQASDATAVDLKYDNNGNRIEDGSYSYEYDAFDNLVKVTDKSGGQTILEFVYDAAGRIMERKDNGGTTRFVFDGPRVIEELSANARIQNAFGSGLDEIIVTSDASSNKFCHVDDINNLRAVTDSRGDLLQLLDYSSFGEPSLFGGGGDTIALQSAVVAPLFGGRPFLRSSGLYEFRKRFYDPAAGTFLQRDAYNYADSANPYLYCKHNPVGLVDPNGRIAPIIIGIAAAAALGAGAGAVFGSIRQGLQIATGCTDEYGNVKDEFDWNELGINVGIGGALGIGIFVFPPLAIAMAGFGVLGGLSEIAQGNTLVGAFDIGTSIFGTKGLKQFKGTTIASRFERLGFDMKISMQGVRLRFTSVLKSLLPSRASKFEHLRQLALSRTAENRVGLDRVGQSGLRAGVTFKWRPEFLRDPRKTAGEVDVMTRTEIDEVKTGDDFMTGLTTTYNKTTGAVEHLGQLDKLAMFFPEQRINLWVRFRSFTDPTTGRTMPHREFQGRLNILQRDFPAVNVWGVTPAHLEPPRMADFSSPLAPLANADPSKLVDLMKRGAGSPSQKN